MMRAEAQLTSRNDQSSLEALLNKTIDTISALGPQFDHYHRHLSDLNTRFGEGRFHLAVLGQFKRGKSTLLNALIGESILPVGVVPLTAAPTFVQYGNEPKVRVKTRGADRADEFTGASTEERSAYLARFVTEEENPKNRLGVTEVEVSLASPILADGVVLIDTPGIGSTFRHNTTATLNFLQQCDAALFLISADPPITEVELEFLRQVREKVPRLFFVLNKIDYLNEDELAQALAFTQRTLTEHTGGNGDLRVFCISARKGLEARKINDSDAWTESGMAALETFLKDFLVKEKWDALVDAVSQRAMDWVEAAGMEAAIALKAMKLPQEELEEKIVLFGESLKRAESERRLIQDVLTGDKKRVSAFLEEEARTLREEAETFLKDIMKQGPRGFGKSGKAGVQAAWADAIPEFFGEQQAGLDERVKAHLLECLSPHEERLDKLVETLRHTAADLFQVPYRPLHREDALEIKRRPYWVLNSWNTDLLPILKSMDQRMDELVRRNVENIRWAMLQNLNISFAHFATRIKERLTETVAATKGAMEAAGERRRVHGGSIAADLAHMEAQIATLEGLKTAYAELRGGAE